MSLPYPYYTEPREDYAEVEAILTIIHEDGPDTTHPIIVQLEHDSEDLVSAVVDDRYWAEDDEALEAALKTKADFEVTHWDDAQEDWAGASPFAA